MSRDPLREPVVGHYYLTVLCQSCQAVIPLAPDPQRNRTLAGSGTLQIGCPYCGKSHGYQPTEVATRQLVTAVPTTH